MYKALTGYFYMVKPVGGRGYKAPYQTTHVRVPVDIKGDVEVLIDNYRNKVLGIDDNNSLTSSDKVLTSSDDNLLPTLEDSIKLADDILKRKQSARKSMAMLLSAIYNSNVEL
jgi:hypothetical protein